VLGATTAALGQYRNQLKVSGKVAGIHWQYKTNSHAAECTAGYTNTNGVDPYRLIADVYHTYGVQFDFTVLFIFIVE
jgi:beta-amylase